MLQAVPENLTDDFVDITEGWEPWRFPLLDAAIKRVVAQGIEGDANARAVFATIRDFTVLQRMFRLALSGDLGTSFPLDQLITRFPQYPSSLSCSTDNPNGSV
jgi:hypothetical protein